MQEDQILDHPMDENEKRKDVLRNLAGNGKRFANMIIDVIGFYVLVFLIGIAFASTGDMEIVDSPGFTLSSYLIYVLYYWAFETLTGKTLGKYITRTRIVKEDGSKPEPINILGRSFARLIPFDGFSFLGTPGKGWHDSIPKIYVINDD